MTKGNLMTDSRTEIPLAQAEHQCGCGHEHDAEPVLDARAIPHAIRHATIFGALDSIAPGAGLVLIAPHDPLPLLGQVYDIYGDAIEVAYLDRAPQAVRLKLTKTHAVSE